MVAECQIARERVRLGLPAQKSESIDGEGGGEGARLDTVLPLIRVTVACVILLLAVLAVLGELGINILPFLADAGVVGLAASFGAQSLVRDIVAGIFCLIDVAFRLGEYVDIGDV